MLLKKNGIVCSVDLARHMGLKYEAYNSYREISRMQSREVSFSSFTVETMEQFATYDRYPWEYTAFAVGGNVILIEDDRLADALNALPQEHRGSF